MKRFFGIMSLVAVIMMMVACGGKKEHQYIGKFTDEFGNKFELREDHKAFIQFVGFEKVSEEVWSDGDNHDLPYAIISFNGTPAYYYLRDGVLYNSMENMAQGHPAIQITWEDD